VLVDLVLLGLSGAGGVRGGSGAAWDEIPRHHGTCRPAQGLRSPAGCRGKLDRRALEGEDR
jgi:hypothetical protein